MNKRKVASNLILFSFFLMVIFAALFSEFFKNPARNSAEVIEQARLFSSSDLGLIKKISLKNKSGEYVFERKDLAPSSPWQMVSPREVSANSIFIEKLFKEISQIKVKKVFADEPLNQSKFSLDRPTATLSLMEETGRAINIQIGLMNTIDNSTYIKLSSKNGIYHVEAPSSSLENATINDLIESQIVPVKNTLAAIRIAHSGKTQLEIKKNNMDWTDQEGRPLSNNKVDDFLQELQNLKSTFILDKLTDAQKKQVSSLNKVPAFVLTLEDIDPKSNMEFVISPLIKSFSELDLKNDEYFLVSQTGTTTAYVVKKTYFDIFNRKLESLKEAGDHP